MYLFRVFGLLVFLAVIFCQCYALQKPQKIKKNKNKKIIK